MSNSNHPDGTGEQPIERGSAVILAETNDTRGVTVLRRRDDRLELIVNGVFAMDSAHTLTEEALADAALRELPDGPVNIVVGGLGLGYTARRLLDDPRVQDLLIVELEAALLRWAREGLVQPADQVLDDPRTTVITGDVLTVVPGLPPGSAHAVLLDVDNGPGFLVHTGNQEIYATAFLRAAATALCPGGVLGIWSADPAPELAEVLRLACGPTQEILLDVERDGRSFQYAVYLAVREPSQ